MSLKVKKKQKCPTLFAVLVVPYANVQTMQKLSPELPLASAEDLQLLVVLQMKWNDFFYSDYHMEEHPHHIGVNEYLFAWRFV